MRHIFVLLQLFAAYFDDDDDDDVDVAGVSI